MGTRSQIGVMHGEKIKAVYCHWDGYLTHNGRVLFEHYNSAKANELVSLGNLSILAPKLHPTEGSGHSFGNAEDNVCVFYDRDRKEIGQQFATYYSLGAWASGSDAAYFYVMKDGNWYVSQDGKTLELLITALSKEGLIINTALAVA